jgi:hypothetical protein
MDSTLYLNIFQQAGNQLDDGLLHTKQIKWWVGMYGDSVCLKLYKTAWANKLPDALSAASRIFFSVWINDETIKQGKLMYNIHALKLRQLEGHKITSRDFANDFRTSFGPFENKWPNVSTAFGPLTLMEGFAKIDLNGIEHEVVQLANQFIAIDYLIDKLLDERRI